MPTVFEFACKLSNSFVRISCAAFLTHECKKFLKKVKPSLTNGCFSDF